MMNSPAASIALSIMAVTMVFLPLVLILPATNAYGEIYTWKDSRGTSHYVNSEYDIPVPYRSKARVLDLGETPKTGNPSGVEITPPPQGGNAGRPAPMLPSRVEPPASGRSGPPWRTGIRRDSSRDE